MEDEKLLPAGVSKPEITYEGGMRIHRRPLGGVPQEPALPVMPKFVPPVQPVTARTTPASLPGVPSRKQQSWGAVVSIVIIVLMIIIGAFYSWGQRISQGQIPTASTSTQ